MSYQPTAHYGMKVGAITYPSLLLKLVLLHTDQTCFRHCSVLRPCCACCAAEDPAEGEDLASSTQRYLNDSLEQANMAEAFEPEEFKGMLYHDGVDSQGRPVIVVNTDAVGTGRKARSQAMQHMLHRLEPIVTQVGYEPSTIFVMANRFLCCRHADTVVMPLGGSACWNGSA